MAFLEALSLESPWATLTFYPSNKPRDGICQPLGALPQSLDWLSQKTSPLRILSSCTRDGILLKHQRIDMLSKSVPDAEICLTEKIYIWRIRAHSTMYTNLGFVSPQLVPWTPRLLTCLPCKKHSSLKSDLSILLFPKDNSQSSRYRLQSSSAENWQCRNKSCGRESSTGQISRPSFWNQV